MLFTHTHTHTHTDSHTLSVPFKGFGIYPVEFLLRNFQISLDVFSLTPIQYKVSFMNSELHIVR